VHVLMSRLTRTRVLCTSTTSLLCTHGWTRPHSGLPIIIDRGATGHAVSASSVGHAIAASVLCLRVCCATGHATVASEPQGVLCYRVCCATGCAIAASATRCAATATGCAVAASVTGHAVAALLPLLQGMLSLPLLLLLPLPQGMLLLLLCYRACCCCFSATGHAIAVLEGLLLLLL
jgi:hypothetical protein